MIVLPDCFNAGDVLKIPFDSYVTAGGSGSITGLAVTDIEIYKEGSTTQRASDNGYALLDTDGIDFDGSVGLNGFSIDTGDNSDSGFWADGNQYWIHINAITVDSQTVRFTFFLALGFSLRPTVAGRKLDVSAGGEGGIDLANVGSPTTTLNLPNTTVGTVTTLTGHTPQTGDAYARLGAPAGASVSADIASVKTDTGTTILGRLPASLGANGNIKADVRDYNGTAGTFASGKPEVNVGANGISASSMAQSSVDEIVSNIIEFVLIGAEVGVDSLGELLQEVHTAVSTNIATLLSRLGTPSNLGSGATVAGNLVDIEGQTDDIGVAGAGLTALPAVTVGAINAAGVQDLFTVDSGETQNSAVDGSLVKETANRVWSSPSSGWGILTMGESFVTFFSITANTILNRLGNWTASGRNTLLGAFQALFRSDVDASVPSDINADLGSGAGDAANTTESLEALRDRGDAAWVTATGFATPTNVTDAQAAIISAISGLNNLTATEVVDALKDDAEWKEILANAGHNFTVTLPGSFPGTGSVVLTDLADTPILEFDLTFNADGVVTGRERTGP